VAELGAEVAIRAEPFGIPVTTPFADDHEHASYDRDAVRELLRILQWSSDVLEQFAGWYAGKTSPVHLFWHSFDLALSRFSGRRAPAMDGVDAVTAEAYSHEVISFGFWAGDDQNPFPAYYSYTAPEPRPCGIGLSGPMLPRGSTSGEAPSPCCATTTSARLLIPRPCSSSSCRARTRRVP
jgi:hypothetical protein